MLFDPSAPLMSATSSHAAVSKEQSRLWACSQPSYPRSTTHTCSCQTSLLWDTDIENFTRNTTRRQDIVFGISYSDDINKAFKSIEKAIKDEERIITKVEDKKTPDHGRPLLGIPLSISLCASGSKTTDAVALKVDVIKMVKEGLDKDGISIPFPTPHNRNGRYSCRSAKKQKGRIKCVDYNLISKVPAKWALFFFRFCLKPAAFIPSFSF